MKVIYILADPRCPNKIRYVGFTVSGVAHRLKAHISFAVARKDRGGRGYCQKWIRSLLLVGVFPIICHLERVTLANWQERERYWIKHLREKGHRLTNCTAGGEGILDLPPDLLARRNAAVSAAHKGKRLSPEHCAKIGAAHMGMKRKQSTRDAIRNALTGKVRPLDVREKIRAKLLGFRHSDETKAKMSEAHKKIIIPPEQRVRMIASIRSDEVRAKISERVAPGKAAARARREAACSV